MAAVSCHVSGLAFSLFPEKRWPSVDPSYRSGKPGLDCGGNAAKQTILAACCCCEHSQRLRSSPCAVLAINRSLKVYVELTEWSSNRCKIYAVAVSRNIYLDPSVIVAGVPSSLDGTQGRQRITGPQCEFTLYVVPLQRQRLHSERMLLCQCG